ncbi:DNA polymerase beta-like [Coccinella septempunctata]|uniref:DNA polymerase beta-like n=1 Tax=Coccinella septempunctata TaxID=41139 RepID=UPI001D0890BB|nr:DNA polymerase beta-like [Coccinella septempunctata]
MSNKKVTVDSIGTGVNYNKDICGILLELAEYERNTNRNIFKYEAYKKAAAVLASHPRRVSSGAEASKLKGIGAKIAKKIDEFYETGKLEKLENIHKDDRSQAINLLAGVSGIGPAKAQSLVDEGITTIEQLRKNLDKLTHHQQIGLKYYEDFQKKIPREEIKEIETIIRKHVSELDKDFVITICGSYRRGKPESGDIDTLITHPSYTNTKKRKKSEPGGLLTKIVDVLKECGLITDTLSLGETKFMGACRLNPNSITRRLDIRLLPQDQYYCGVLYFTGSDMFNKAMRAHALEHGHTINEYCVRPIGSLGTPGEAVPIHSEEEIFEYIQFPYKKPEERNY